MPKRHAVQVSDSLDRRKAALALLLVVPAPSIGAATAFWLAPGPIGQAVYAAGKLVLYGLPLAWHLAIDRRALSWSPPRRGGFGLGLLSGLALSACVGIAWLAFGRGLVDPAALRAQAVDNGFDSALRYLAIAAWLSLVNSALEEYVFRWFLVSRWRALVSERAAIVLAAACFTAHHVVVLLAFFEPPLAIAGSGGVFVGGLVWSWLYARTGSIWPGWLSHLLVDVAVLAVGARILFGAA